jgi:hypothetical protein|tara:strand:- start:78 stop:326 length:249 start_codon:yes stop_codon:yes gene_type:complete
MAKFYIKSGDFETIFSTEKEPYDVCRLAIHEFIGDYIENGQVDELDEHMYIDERGFRNYATADPDTFVVETFDIMKKEGYVK